MRKVSYDSRRPCQPTVTPSTTRARLHREALILDAACDLKGRFAWTPEVARMVYLNTEAMA